MEVKLRFVTESIPGVGVDELSPLIIEEKLLTLVKNSQLLRQLLDAPWNTKQIQLENDELKFMWNNKWPEHLQYIGTSVMHMNARNFQRCRHLRRFVYMLPHQNQMIHMDLSTKVKGKSTNIKDRKWIIVK